MNASNRIIGSLLALVLVFIASPLNAQSVYGQVSGRQWTMPQMYTRIT
jgi:hypothetical protein